MKILLSLTALILLVFSGCSRGRYVALKPIDVNATQPSVINVLFQATGENSEPIPDLTANDFLVYEDNKPISYAESFKNILPRDSMPYKLKTVIAIDVSKSLSVADRERIITTLTDLINGKDGRSFILGPHHEIMIISFSESIRVIQKYTNSREKILEALQKINEPVYETSTNLYGMVAKGVSLWDDNEGANSVTKGFLIVVTDGADDSGTISLQDTIRIRGNKSVYTIGVGRYINDYVLQQLGSAGYIPLHDFHELYQAMQSVLYEIQAYSDSFYVLKYASPKRKSVRGDSIHTMKLEVFENGNRGSDSYISADFDSSQFKSVYPYITIKSVGNLQSENRMVLKADTEWVNTTPQYEWWIENPKLASLTVNHSNNSIATLDSHTGEKGVTNILVRDMANGVEEKYPVAIGVFTKLHFDFEDGNISSELVQSGSGWSIDEGAKSRYSIKANRTEHNKETTIKLSGTFEASKLSFNYKISSEEGCDSLIFYIDGKGYANSGLVDWSYAEYQFEPGEHTFEWHYKKDESDSKYQDTIWLDNIRIE